MLIPLRMLSLERGRNESILLGSVAVCFLLLLLADVVGASTELACFLAGVAITCQTNSVVDHVSNYCCVISALECLPPH